MRKRIQVLTLVVFATLAFHTLAAVVLCTVTLHPRHKPLTDKMLKEADGIARQANAEISDVRMTSFDGSNLSAWFFRDRSGSGDTVILLHGSGDNRAGMLGFVPMFLRHQYNVLVPDLRAHGQSGGEIATFGIKESQDLSRWMGWLLAEQHSRCVYGLGESMGAAILLEALPGEPRFCAVVAESPFSSMREVAYDRLGQRFGAGERVGRSVFRPLIGEAFLYARLHDAVDFDQASAANAVAQTHVPILLIHGTADFNIPVRHCEAILRNHSGPMEFWQVPGAVHTGAYPRAPQEFERRVTEWFSRYSHPADSTHPPTPARAVDFAALAHLR